MINEKKDSNETKDTSSTRINYEYIKAKHNILNEDSTACELRENSITTQTRYKSTNNNIHAQKISLKEEQRTTKKTKKHSSRGTHSTRTHTSIQFNSIQKHFH
jgi:hypothetical protein